MMKRMRRQIVILTCLAISALVFGEEEVRKYTLEDCLRIGNERSGRAVNARRDQAIAKAKIVQARAQALPNLSLSAGYTRLDKLEEIDLGDGPVELGALDNYSLQADISQLLYSGGKVKAALTAAKFTESYADWVRADAEAALERDISTGFYDILLARAAVTVREEAVAQLDSLLKQTEDKFRNGMASEFDVIRAKVAFANEKPKLIAAKNAHQLMVENFRRLLDLGNESFKLIGELEFEPVKLNMEHLTCYAVEYRPAIRAQEAVVKLREQDVDAARSEGLPSLSTVLSYNGANSYQFSYDDDWEWHWNAGLVLTWNFWDGGLTLGTVEEKLLELEKSRTDLDELRKAVRLETKQAYFDMKHAREAVEACSGNVELAEKALAIASARHKAGMATYLEFTDANVALSRAKLTYLTALHDHMNALARLQYSSGFLEKD